MEMEKVKKGRIVRWERVINEGYQILEIHFTFAIFDDMFVFSFLHFNSFLINAI